ncbi:MAG: YggT family protein [Chloroflexaceae bacterium]|jgi:hypothetical protein|nr:YggT family protein [Chloroflexaceae bacterium]
MIDGNRVIHEENRTVRADTNTTEPEEQTTSTVVEEVTRVVPNPRELRRRRMIRVQKAIYAVANIIAVMLFIRILLRGLGANPDNGFAQFYYTLSYPIFAPFANILGPEPPYGVPVLEGSSVVAIIIYYLFAWIIARLISIFFALPQPTGEGSEEPEPPRSST